MKQKVRIIAFLELLFAVDKNERSLSFERVASHCKLEVSDVEYLVMKAMSLELVKGVIDEVDEVVHIDWILPRYLNQSHLEILVGKMRTWEDKMSGLITMSEDN